MVGSQVQPSILKKITKLINAIKLHKIISELNPIVPDSAIVPIIYYSNADTQKIAILNDNRNRAGIYRWVNLITGKTYIGSSGNL